MDVKQEKRIDDYWNIDGSRDLSDPWTGFTQFTLLDEKAPDGYMWSGVRLTRKQLGRIKTPGGDQDLRTSTLIRELPIQGESNIDFLGESEGSLPQPQDSFPDAGEAIKTFGPCREASYTAVI